MLTLAMPQSLPGSRHEAFGLAQVGGEDRRRQALRHAVVQGDRLVEVVVARSRRGSVRTSRCARCRSGRASRRSPGGRRTRPGASSAERPLAAGDELAALGRQRPRSTAACDRTRRRRSSGPTSVPSASGSPIGSDCVGPADALDELVVDRPVHDQAAQAGAALAGGAGGREDDATQCQVEVGRRGDDRGVVAAELEDRHDRTGPRRPAPPCGPSPSNRWPRRSATPSWAASAAPTRTPPSTTCTRWSGAPASAAARSNSAAHASAVSGVLSLGFQITGSPATSGQRRVPRPHGDREVEGADDADRSHRVPCLHEAVTGSLRWRW